MMLLLWLWCVCVLGACPRDITCTRNANCESGEICREGTCIIPDDDDGDEGEGEGEEGEGEEGEGEEGEGEEGEGEEGEGEEGEGEEGEGEGEVVCGDGVVRLGEDCDDQNSDRYDGCHACQSTSLIQQNVLGDRPALQQTLHAPTGLRLSPDGSSVVVLDNFGVYRAWFNADRTGFTTTTRLVDLRVGRAGLEELNESLTSTFTPRFGIAEVRDHIYFCHEGSLWRAPSTGGIYGSDEVTQLVRSNSGDNSFDFVLVPRATPTPLPALAACVGVTQHDDQVYVTLGDIPLQVIALSEDDTNATVIAGVPRSAEISTITGLTAAQSVVANATFLFQPMGDGSARWGYVDSDNDLIEQRINLSTGALSPEPSPALSSFSSRRVAIVPTVLDNQGRLWAAFEENNDFAPVLLRRFGTPFFGYDPQTFGDNRRLPPFALAALPDGSVLAARWFPSRIERIDPAAATPMTEVISDVGLTQVRGQDFTGRVQDIAHGGGTTVVLIDGVVWELTATNQLVRRVGMSSCGTGEPPQAFDAVAVSSSGQIYAAQPGQVCTIDGANVVTRVAGFLSMPNALLHVNNLLLVSGGQGIAEINLDNNTSRNLPVPSSTYSDLLITESGARLAVNRDRQVIIDIDSGNVVFGIINNSAEPPDGSASNALPLGGITAAYFDSNLRLFLTRTGIHRIINGSIARLTPAHSTQLFARRFEDGPVAQSQFDGFVDVVRLPTGEFLIATPSSVRKLDNNDVVTTVVGSDRLQELGALGRLHAAGTSHSLACDSNTMSCIYASVGTITARSATLHPSSLRIDLATSTVQVNEGQEALPAHMQVVARNPEGVLAFTDGNQVTNEPSEVAFPPSIPEEESVAAMAMFYSDGPWYLTNVGALHSQGAGIGLDLTPGSLSVLTGQMSVAASATHVAATYGGVAKVAVVTHELLREPNLASISAVPFITDVDEPVTSLHFDSDGGLWILHPQSLERWVNAPLGARQAVDAVRFACAASMTGFEQNDVLSLVVAEPCTGSLQRILVGP
jgi:hypothetical protein